MFNPLGNLFNSKPPPKKGAPMMQEVPSMPTLRRRDDGAAKSAYSKVFRWRLPDGQTQAPGRVEIVGSFTHWKPVPLHRDSVCDAWHATIHHIPGNKTHHYMLLVDGNPTNDKTCDGIVPPHGHDEERFAIHTERGPRVFMLFAQTK